MSSPVRTPCRSPTSSPKFERLGAAGKARCAARAAETNQWRHGNDKSAADWLAKRTGTTVGAAKEALAAAALPELAEGELTLTQAAAVAGAAAVAPDRKDELLDAARKKTVRELRERAERVKQEALPDDAARHEAIRRSRSLHEWVGADGAWNLRVRNTKDAGARFMAALRPWIDAEFRKARAEGRREELDAYAADAMQAMAEGGGSSKPTTKMILRADLTAVRRGRVVDGEICDIPGLGPVPVAAVRELLPDAWLALVLTKGKDVVNVTHLGRQPTAHQQTALEWLYPTCEVDGCTSAARLERDHVEDWARTRHTRLDELQRLCHFHHDLKTQGKLVMVPP